MKRNSRKAFNPYREPGGWKPAGRNFRRRLGATGGTPLRLVKPETLRWAVSQSGWNRE